MNQEYVSDAKIPRMTLNRVEAVGSWAGEIRGAIINERERRERGGNAELPDGQIELGGLIYQMLEYFEAIDLFVPLERGEWAVEAAVFVEDIDNLLDADALTLRKLLSYHKQKAEYAHSGEMYWVELAMTGHLMRILVRFSSIFREKCERTLV